MRANHANWRYLRTPYLLVLAKQRCRDFERANYLRNHSESRAALRDVVRLGTLIEGRTQ